MMMKCKKIFENLINNVPTLFSCYELENYLVIETPFLYPDGDPIELFIHARKQFIEVTDMGETLRFLMSYGFDINVSQKRRKVFHDILASMGARYFKGAISIRTENYNYLTESIFSLSQVILRTCDLLFTAKPRGIGNFRDEVREVLDYYRLSYEEDYCVRGHSGTEYQLDFGVAIDDKIKLVRLLSPQSPDAINSLIDRVIRSWLDISVIVPDTNLRISVIDDVDFSWKTKDIELIKLISLTCSWSNKGDFIRKLKSA